MATKQQVLDTVAAEKLQVQTKINGLETTIAEQGALIQQLQEQINNGHGSDLDEINTAVEDIIVP